MKKQKVAKKQIPYLDYMCRIGEKVQWEDLTHKKFIGKLIAMDEECLATVELEDGTVVHYQC
jgi:hypothetical protein